MKPAFRGTPDVSEWGTCGSSEIEVGPEMKWAEDTSKEKESESPSHHCLFPSSGHQLLPVP